MDGLLNIVQAKFKKRKRQRPKPTQHPSSLTNLRYYFTEYTENTSLHGVRYFGECKRSWQEKIWWIFVFALSLCFCLAQISRIYRKWESTPVIVSFAQTPTPVWHIPFPAITICSEIKVRQTVFNITDIYHRLSSNSSSNVTAEELKYYNQATLVCWESLLANESLIDKFNMTFYDDISPVDLVWYCQWMNNYRDCQSIFSKIVTDDGICYTFNMLDMKDIYNDNVYQLEEYANHSKSSSNWSVEAGYKKGQRYPIRAFSAGSKAGLTVYSRSHLNDADYICRGPSQGYTVTLHHPGQIPRVTQQNFRVGFNREVIVSVRPEMMTTSENVKRYDPHRRFCYFSGERKLKFFRHYSQENCDIECYANYTLESCDCVQYYMPHEKGVPICGPFMADCVSDAYQAMLIENVLLDTDELHNTSSNILHMNCDCLPSCTTLTYNAETSQAEYNFSALYKALQAMSLLNANVRETSISFFFKENQFISSQRNELYGVSDFIANCGGLLGLCIGFSLISLVEILYFCTLRLACNFKKFGKYFWSGSPELIHKYDKKN